MGAFPPPPLGPHELIVSHTMIATKPPTSEPWVEIIRRKVGAMRSGSIHLTIHDGRVTQVEATEKTRLTSMPEPSRDTQEAEES